MKFAGSLTAVIIPVVVGCAKVEFRSAGERESHATESTEVPGNGITDPNKQSPIIGLEIVSLSDGASLEIDRINKAAYIRPTVRAMALLGLNVSLTFLGELPFSPDIDASCTAMRDALSEGKTIYSTLFSHRAGYYELQVQDKADFYAQAQSHLEARGLTYAIGRRPVRLSVRNMAAPSLMIAANFAPRRVEALVGRLSQATADRMPLRLSIGELCDLISEDMDFTLSDQGESLSFRLNVSGRLRF